MDRLTRRVCGTTMIADAIDGKYTAEKLIDILVERLAAYEETGMTPEDVADAKKMIEKDVAFEVSKICTIEETTIPRLREMAEADKEGRLVVLPCKLGTPIWWIDVTIEPNDRGKWVIKKRIKSTTFSHSVLDWIDTPWYVNKKEAEDALIKEKEDN